LQTGRYDLHEEIAPMVTIWASTSTNADVVDPCHVALAIAMIAQSGAHAVRSDD
jgi:hypothetical protein